MKRLAVLAFCLFAPAAHAQDAAGDLARAAGELLVAASVQLDSADSARDRVRAELMDLSLTHKSCGQCGSFGRDFKAKFLQSAIDTLTRDHDLPKADPLPPVDWAVPMGLPFRQGRGLNASWHSKAPETPPRRAAIYNLQLFVPNSTAA